MKHCSLLAALFVCAGMMTGTADTVAQPLLQSTRVVSNWPTIELYFSATCDGQTAANFNKSQFIVRENGLDVDDFTLTCFPDSCPISVALVLDASGSMDGVGNAAAKAGAHAFVDNMDGIADEAAIIWFSSTVHIELGISTNKTDLHSAVNALSASGSTAAWDGMYAGLREIIQNGQSNACRAIVVLTDGGDNASSHSPDEVIALANREGIRVFTIGLGSVSPSQLETIAMLTGGKYYQVTSPEAVVDVYNDIFALIRAGFEQCMITYTTGCKDGGVRTVNITVKDFCNGSDTKTLTYKAPRDTTTYSDMDITLGVGAIHQGKEAAVPLRFDLPIQGPALLHSSVFTFTFDENCLRFSRFDAPQGTLLNGIPVNVRGVPGGIEVRVLDRVVVQSGGTLANLYFTTATNPADSISCPVQLTSWQFEAGCFRPVLHSGKVVVYNSETPVIIVEGMHTICEGDSVRLSTTYGFTDFLWSTGETAISIWVSKAGTYSVTAKNRAGLTYTSSPVTIVVLPKPSPGISPEGTIAVCHGTQVSIQADGGYEEYRWSTGASTTSITATREGTFSYMVRSTDGCWGQSKELTIQYKSPDPEISGDFFLCGQDSIGEYSVAAGNNFDYRWTVVGGIALTRKDSSGIRVRINGKTATISAEVYDPLTGCRVTSNRIATVYEGPAQLQVNGGLILCTGDSADLFIDPIYSSYEWNTGSRESFIHPKNSGEYYCKVTNGPCTFYTDTVHITALKDVQMSIMGDNIVCQNGTAMYSAPQIEGMSYRWRLEGESTDARSGNPVTLQFAGGQSAKVILHYGPAGCPDSLTLNVNLVPGLKPTVTIDPDSLLCEGDSIILDASGGFTDYRWSNGQTTQSIVVTESGTYSVSAVGPNGCRALSLEHTITVLPAPPKPAITQSGNLLTCTITAANYIWFKDGVIIPGENNQTLVISESAIYEVVAIGANGCRSESDPMTFTGIGNYAPMLASAFSITPNPSSGDFTVALEFERPTAFSMRIVNAAGQLLYNRTVHEQRTSYHGSVTLDGASAGVYFLILESAGMYDFRKVIVRPH